MTGQAALKEQIVEELGRLSQAQLERVHGYVEALVEATPEGTPTEDLLPFVGILDDLSAREMEAAIAKHCEQIEEP